MRCEHRFQPSVQLLQQPARVLQPVHARIEVRQSTPLPVSCPPISTRLQSADDPLSPPRRVPDQEQQLRLEPGAQSDRIVALVQHTRHDRVLSPSSIGSRHAPSWALQVLLDREQQVAALCSQWDTRCRRSRQTRQRAATRREATYHSYGSMQDVLQTHRQPSR